MHNGQPSPTALEMTHGTVDYASGLVVTHWRVVNVMQGIGGQRLSIPLGSMPGGTR